MPSIAQRASIMAIAAATLALPAIPASAQGDRTAVLNILVECAKIDDPTARLACYDNNIRAAGGNPSSIPGQMAVPGGGGNWGGSWLAVPEQNQHHCQRRQE